MDEAEVDPGAGKLRLVIRDFGKKHFRRGVLLSLHERQRTIEKRLRTGVELRRFYSNTG